MAYTFFGEGNCFLGVELEMDQGGRDYDKGDTIKATTNSVNQHIYAFWSDCSLRSGWEFVSNPCTLEYHKNSFGWKNLLAKAVELGYDTGYWNADYDGNRTDFVHSAGMHVHISRTAFGEDDTEQNFNIAKLALITERFPDQMFSLSRRIRSSFQYWANLWGTTDLNRLLRKVNDCDGGKSVAVNFDHDYTVEIRLFASTLDYNTFMGNLEFVQLLVNVANTHSVNEINEMTWQEFVDKALGYGFGFFLRLNRVLIEEAVAA